MATSLQWERRVVTPRPTSRKCFLSGHGQRKFAEVQVAVEKGEGVRLQGRAEGFAPSSRAGPPPPPPTPSSFVFFLLFYLLVQPAPGCESWAQKSQAADNEKALLIGFRCEQESSLSLCLPEQISLPNHA